MFGISFVISFVIGCYKILILILLLPNISFAVQEYDDNAIAADTNQEQVESDSIVKIKRPSLKKIYKLRNRNRIKYKDNKGVNCYFNDYNINISNSTIYKKQDGLVNVNYFDEFNITLNILLLKSQYFYIKTIQNIDFKYFYNKNNEVAYNINLGFEFGNDFIGSLGLVYDKLSANKLFIDDYNIINWQSHYRDSSNQFIEDYYFLKMYYKTPSIFGLTFYSEFIMHDKQINKYIKHFSNKKKISIIDNIAKTDIFNMQNLNNNKYFNYKQLFDKSRAYIADFGLNFKTNSINVNNTKLYVQADFSTIYAIESPNNDSHELQIMQNFLNLSKNDFHGNLSDEIIKINSGVNIRWEVNAFLLNSLNIGASYSLSNITSPRFALVPAADALSGVISGVNSVNIKKYSNNNHHLFSGSIKLDNDIFISSSFNYMFGDQSLYNNNNLFDSAILMPYSILNANVIIGYVINNLFLINDALTLDIKMQHNMNDFIKQSSYYTFGIEVQYDL